jgi:DNA-binding MarR family transcriptional regulator
VNFEETRTVVARDDVADSPDLAEKLTVAQRMKHLLRSGAMTVRQIAEELDIDANTVTQTVNRYAKKGRLFIVLGGENTNRRLGLLEQERTA